MFESEDDNEKFYRGLDENIKETSEEIFELLKKKQKSDPSFFDGFAYGVSYGMEIITDVLKTRQGGEDVVQ